MRSIVVYLFLLNPVVIACDGDLSTVQAGSDAQSLHGAVCPTRGNNDAGGIAGGSALWLKGFDDRLEITGIASDSGGNVLLARSGVQTAKLNPDGQLLWSKPFGQLVAADRIGNIYVAGRLEGTVDLGNELLTSKGGTDVYVVKLNPRGEVLHGTTLGGPSDEDVLSLAVDSLANVVVSGNGLGTVKIDHDDNILWAKNFYGHVALDSADNVLLTGTLTGAVDFGAGTLTSSGGGDVFVAKLGPNGEHIFSHRFGDAADLQQGQALAVDRSDNVIIAGVFEGALDFGSGSLAFPRCPEEVWCKTAGFVTKFDSRGQLLWSRSFDTMRELQGVAVDSMSDVVFSGALPGGVPPYRIPVVSELDSRGAAIWRRAEWPESGIGAGHRVAIDPCDNVVWSLSALPAIGSNEQAYVSKLSP